ncbi:glycosyltransferase family 2 protein [Lunatimonas salinarum]|uniref:glycosyltransferase family 2 protein n=1 Tax=Lunatimonas salinarum TaxID=1774590 RepID=UPI001ADF1F75|nr:glycosyltransferase family 2 protein [Lunatimonas salinarum]
MKISIITVVFNDREGVFTTLSSISSQTYRQTEVIIVDGLSTDGTVDVVRQFDQFVSCFISEPDEGIYDAMNKGLRLATGDFVIFLNAGDYFASNLVLASFASAVADRNSVYFGRALVSSHDDSWHFPPLSVDENSISAWLKHNVPNHQAMFFPKCFYKESFFDTTLKISADADYKLKAQKISQIPFVFLDQVISVFELGGVSTSYTDLNTALVRARDSWKVNRKYFGLLVAFKRLGLLGIKVMITSVLGEDRLVRTIKSVKSR